MLVSNSMTLCCTRARIQFLSRAMVTLSSLVTSWNMEGQGEGGMEGGREGV